MESRRWNKVAGQEEEVRSAAVAAPPLMLRPTGGARARPLFRRSRLTQHLRSCGHASGRTRSRVARCVISSRPLGIGGCSITLVTFSLTPRRSCQFVAETDEQWQHLAALRKELEELSVTLATLQVKRQQTCAEAEEEERRVLDARRLRSQLKKGLHDAQKRVDGAGHRSRAALQQLQKLLVQATQFVSTEEEAAYGGPLAMSGQDADPELSTLAAAMVLANGAGGVGRSSTAVGTSGSGTPDFDDSMSCISDRYSVADEAMMVPRQPPGLLGQLLSWARGVLSIRCVVSLSEVSLTVSPGARRRRKRGTRARPRGPPLHEISEAPDPGDETIGLGDDTAAPSLPSLAVSNVALRAAPPQFASPSPSRTVAATAASAAAQAVAAAASVRGGAVSASDASNAAVASVQELSMRLAGCKAGASLPDFGANNSRPSVFKPGSPPTGGMSVQGAANRFNLLVSAAQEKTPGFGPGLGHAARAASLQPARTAPQPPSQQHSQGGMAGAPTDRRSTDRRAHPQAEWPLTPFGQGVSPQSSQERL